MHTHTQARASEKNCGFAFNATAVSDEAGHGWGFVFVLEVVGQETLRVSSPTRHTERGLTNGSKVLGVGGERKKERKRMDKCESQERGW